MLRDDLAKIDLPAGIFKNSTQYQTKGRYFDGNLVRWVEGQLRPVLGWVRLTTAALTGKARDMIVWADNSGDRWIAIGTSSHLYASHGDGIMSDITPAGFIVGADDSIEGLGYGGGLYGSDDYGTPRPGGSYLPLALWSLDTWGEYLVGCSRDDGKIYEWQLNTAADAAVLSNAPTDCAAILVTDQRHLMAFGAGGEGTRVEWSDKEDSNTWAPAADNEAGGFNLQSQSQIQAGTRVRGTNLAVTRTDAHAISYVGAPFYYGRERIGADCGTPAPASLIGNGSEAFWMGDGCFWRSDGTTVVQLECDVSAHVFGSINKIQIEKTVAGHVPTHGEVWWHYPSNGSNEPDRYVFFNYRGGFWSIGSMARTCWDAGSVLGFPHAVGVDGHLYRHEDGFLDNTDPRFSTIFAESGALELGVGAQIAHVSQIIPDEENSGEVTLTFKTRYTPNGEEFTKGPYIVRGDGYTDARFSGRQATMRITPTVDDDFTIGVMRLNATPGGRR